MLLLVVMVLPLMVLLFLLALCCFVMVIATVAAVVSGVDLLCDHQNQLGVTMVNIPSFPTASQTAGIFEAN